MSTPCTVIIGAHRSTRRATRARGGGEVLTFSDNERSSARSDHDGARVIALERLFAATSRGAALINRIKADPALSAEIRVVSHDGSYACRRGA